MPEDSFPRRFARTARFTAGTPRAFVPSPDGARLAFVRSGSGIERAGRLWVLDTATGRETQVADALVLLAGEDEELTAQEKSRRERMREGGAGITAFSTDEAVATAAFALSSRLFVADLTGAEPTGAEPTGDDPTGATDASAGNAGEPGRIVELRTAGPVIDPRLSPDGRTVAYVSAGSVYTAQVDAPDAEPVLMAEPESGDVTYGLADFAAAEELDRFRGHWWSPASDRLLIARVDTGKVPIWYIADPADPSIPPAEHRYPAAGTTNADVSLWLAPLTGDDRVEVTWDHDAFPYLAQVSWSSAGAPLLFLLSRLQERALVVSVDASTGATATVRELTDPAWVDVVAGTPAWTAAGELVTVEVAGDRYALCVDGEPVSPNGIQIRRIVHTGNRVVAVGTLTGGAQHVYAWTRERGFEPVTTTDGVHAATGNDSVTVLASASLQTTGTAYRVLRDGESPLEAGTPVVSRAEDPGLRPEPRLLLAGARQLPTAVVFPTGWQPGGHCEVVRAAGAYLEDQWWADQGFCVVIADGRGTPGSPAWERTVRFDLATAPLADQVDALRAVAEEFAGALDLDRVAIRGWSFGGFLAGLAVLHRPDVFHAAVAGAPVTRYELYDTAYTERYLGLPSEHPEAYAASSLIEAAPRLTRPLLIIHGLADDNVTAAHSLQLSSALLAAGRPHTFLPLSGVTHMTPQEVVTENLLLLQLEFLRSALGIDN
jgi:dipeptidyl-peptidase 4